MMKVILSVLMVVSQVVFADSGATPAPIDPVRGHWSMESRICSSGLPPRDGFVIGRDEFTMSFFDGNYDAHSRIAQCNYWTTGSYRTQGSMLRVFNVSGGSNCPYQVPAREGSVVFNSVDGKLKLTFGPYGYGGTCPQSDLLEVTFKAL